MATEHYYGDFEHQLDRESERLTPEIEAQNQLPRETKLAFLTKLSIEERGQEVFLVASEEALQELPEEARNSFPRE